MSVRLTTCNKCGGTNLETIKEINPDTTRSNMKAILKCKCGYDDEYLITSHYHNEQRRKGFRI